MAGRSHRPADGKRDAAREPSAPDLPEELGAGALPADDLTDGALHLCLAFEDADLSGREAAGFEIDQSRYRNVNLSRVSLRRATVRDAIFERCDLANLRARDSSMTRTAASGCRMTGLSWLGGDLRDITFRDCRMDMSSLHGSTLKNAVFAGCRLEQADLGEADLSGTRFEDCDLTGAQFSGARMTGTVLRGCNLTGITGVTSLRGAVVTSTDLMTLVFTLAAALGIRIEDD